MADPHPLQTGEPRCSSTQSSALLRERFSPTPLSELWEGPVSGMAIRRHALVKSFARSRDYKYLDIVEGNYLQPPATNASGQKCRSIWRSLSPLPVLRGLAGRPPPCPARRESRRTGGSSRATRDLAPALAA